MITIKDVASLANVSTATASRALRNLGYISKETYERVTNAATQLGYIANATAQQLKTNTFRTVGFIISDIKNEYYFGILSHLHELLSSNGMELIIAFSVFRAFICPHSLTVRCNYRNLFITVCTCYCLLYTSDAADEL